MKHRAYDGPQDVTRLQAFTARQIRAYGRVGLMHPGDIPHRIFNALRRDDPDRLVHLWEDARGDIVAWTLLDPDGAGFDLQICSAVREVEPDLERKLIVWSEEELLEQMTSRESTAPHIETEAFVEDVPRTTLLAKMGWVALEVEAITLSRRLLVGLRSPELPPGYRLRRVRGVEEAGSVSALHSAAFGSSWTPDMYRRVMESPGYEADREIVVEASDGTLAAFCIIWPDELNRIGLFEPVAVHPDHRRRGLGRAVMRAGMQAMIGWGMEWAEVMYEVTNPGADPLYRGEGFEPLWKVTLYRKPVSRGS